MKTLILTIFCTLSLNAYGTDSPPEMPSNETLVQQAQGQAQGQIQAQGQSQSQDQRNFGTNLSTNENTNRNDSNASSSANNSGVSSSADGSTTVSVDTDVPAVTVGLGASSSSPAYYGHDCVVPAAGGFLKRSHNVLGLWSVGQKSVVDERCWELELASRQLALDKARWEFEQSKREIVEVPVDEYIEQENTLVACQTDKALAETSLERCEERITGAK